MPKMKRHKGLTKRMKVSANGKLRYNKSCAGHKLSQKDGSRRRRLRKRVDLDNPTMVARLRRLMLS
ncbi:MAG: 50S ribosomal protein L35 [Phycisphaerales bacterium]|nr:50S ribosomal protein L35 [Phycisphaerales bacterium]